METRITNIGNSKGIIIPKKLLEQCGLSERVKLKVKDDGLLISPKVDNPRAGWEEAIVVAGVAEDDELLMGDYLEHSWDEEEWTSDPAALKDTASHNVSSAKKSTRW